MTDQHGEIMEKLGRLEAGVFGIQNEMKRMNGSISENKAKIIEIDLWRSGLIGKFSVLSIFIGAGITITMNWLYKSFIKS